MGENTTDIFFHRPLQTILLSILFIFLLLPAEATTLPSFLNYVIPNPAGLWYGGPDKGLATSFINVLEIFIWLILLFYFGKELLDGSLSFKIDKILIFGIGFYLVSFFSLLYSYFFTYSDVLDSFPLDGIINFAKAFTLYFIFLQVADEEFMHRLLRMLMYIGFLLALVSILAFFIFGYFKFHQRFGGWRVNVLGMGFNTGGTFLACTALIIYSHIRKRIWYIYMLIPVVLATLLTGSRAALFSLLIAIIIYHYVLSGRDQSVYWKVLKFILPLFLLIIIFTSESVLVALHQLTGFTIFIRLLTLTQFQEDVSAYSRLFIWYNYTQLFLKDFLFGIGNSDWLIEIISKGYGYPHRVPHSHSFILQTFLKGGLVGTTIIAWVFLRSGIVALSSSRESVLFIGAIALIPIILTGFIGYGFWNMKLIYLFTILLFSVGYFNEKNQLYIVKMG